MNQGEFDVRVRFVAELARRLHQYGTSAPRLERAIDNVSARLGLVPTSLSTPTSITLSFADPADGIDALPHRTMVLRVNPGDVNLRRLCEVDAIAERVVRGELNIDRGLAELRAVRSSLSVRAVWLQVLSFGIAGGTVAALIHATWVDVIAAAAIGLFIGLLALVAERRPNFAPSFEAVAAFVAMLAASFIASSIVPLNVRSVLIASLIVLMPGLTLTTAVSELSTQHLVAGTVRLMGATAVLLKLSLGTVAGVQVAKAAGWIALPGGELPVPPWAEWVALLAASYSFAVLFQAARRDYLLVMASAWLGYLATRYGSIWAGPEFGVFIGGLVVGSVANIYARQFERPGALVRVPGIILLVPGSVGFRSLFFAFERDVYLSLDTAFSLLAILIALVAGLLFGNLLVPPRRSI
ncbi:MAG TPA: threonine/serine exporter family protein [Pseudomonadota bacterium]|nr:threonine/serine exporter family protein [Xanthomonadales bacterium]HQW80318.1 threonine/serine exporter family protein [Pseudomonadota bacterium]